MVFRGTRRRRFQSNAPPRGPLPWLLCSSSSPLPPGKPGEDFPNHLRAHVLSFLSQVSNSGPACLGEHLTADTCDLIVFASKTYKNFEKAETNASHFITANQDTNRGEGKSFPLNSLIQVHSAKLTYNP